MTFDKATYDYLAQFDDQFRTARDSRWARHPGHYNLIRMARIYSDATGQDRHVNTSCQSCVLGFLTDLGRLYFADKEERARKAARATKKPKAEKSSSAQR